MSLLGVALTGTMFWMALELFKLKTRLESAEQRFSARAEEARRERLRLKQDAFMHASHSAEEATRALIAWTHMLTEHATSVVFDAGDRGFRPQMTEHEEHRLTVQRAGLGLPPELDRQFHTAVKSAVNVFTAIASAHKQPDQADRRDTCKTAVQAMDKELHVFLNTARVWKKRNWFEITTGEEAPENTFNDVTNPSIMRSRGLLSDRPGAEPAEPAEPGTAEPGPSS